MESLFLCNKKKKKIMSAESMKSWVEQERRGAAPSTRRNKNLIDYVKSNLLTW